MTEPNRDERLALLLQELSQPDSRLRDLNALRQSFPDLAEEARELWETEQELRSAVKEWRSVEDNESAETISQRPTTRSNSGEDSSSAAGLPVNSLPESVGRYRITRRLGQGGMGVVYEANDPQLNRRVAIKIPHFAGSGDLRVESQRRFLREARAAAALEHPNVCSIFDVGEQDGQPFVVMAYVEGKSLAERLRTSSSLESTDAVQLVRKVAMGLAAVHRHGIVHRDLKPGNILIRHADGEPILTDFGLAHLAEDKEHLTADGAVLGTPAYMAPEQADPALGPITAQSDIYSLGVVLFELLTGERPFRGTPMQIILQVASKAMPRASQLRPNIDPELDAIVAKATARDCRERYASAQELTDALEDWSKSRGAASVVSDTPARSSHQTRWWPIGAVVAAALVVAIGAVIVFNRTPRPTEPTSASQRTEAVQSDLNQAPIRGSIDVQVWRRDAADKPPMRLHDPSALPLAPGDWLRIEVELSRPAYAYVVWIDTEGRATPLYPWIETNWNLRPREERRVERMSLPEKSNMMAPLGGGPAGIETLMLLTRDEPLPSDIDASALFAQLPVQEATELRAAAWFENGALVRHEVDRGPIRLDQARETDHPLLKTQTLLRSRLQTVFPYTRSVSFSNRGD